MKVKSLRTRLRWLLMELLQGEHRLKSKGVYNEHVIAFYDWQLQTAK